ncbi:putative Ig domain-containing protein [Halioxenophilus sp. WMMB6]|uniref:putative Ig domain-containing protein n=1 Tax=Halioxenophilus sp. WMMB6 TaxID=3073815 RepID=UPI00295EA980|nr:putative Ig domain-containing protein [Halioxenophilus sp. WMMB6]
MSLLTHLRPLLALLFITTLLFGCHHDDEEEDSGGGVTVEKVSASAQVTDLVGAPISEVTVTIRSASDNSELASATTDANGQIAIAELPTNSDLVASFSKTGFAVQVKPFHTPEQNAPLHFAIALLARELPKAFAAEEEADVVGKDGARVQVAADAFVDSDGNLVGGEIEVSITPVDISSKLGLAAFPGAFAGLLEDGNQVPIASFGSTEFHFQQGDEVLQLAPGATATIELPMYASQYPNGTEVKIGDKIPLWSLNETSGLWQYEGEGEVIASPYSPVGLAMRATASHFSWWNTDWYPKDEELFDFSYAVIAYDTDGNVITDFDGELVSLFIYVGSPTAQVETFAVSNIGETSSGEVFESLWCFEASYDYIFVDDQGSERSSSIDSDVYCKYLSEPTHIDIPLVMDLEFKVDNQLRHTATEGSNYAACGDWPRIKVQSIYPYTLSVVSGSLPPGLELQEDGRLTGTPNQAGSYTFQVDVESFHSDGTRKDYDIVIDTIEVSPALEFSAFEPPYLYVATPITIAAFDYAGGLEPYEVIVLDEDGAVPNGMNFYNGVASGAPGRLIVNGTPTLLYFANVAAVLEDANCAKAYAGYDQGVMWGPKPAGTPEPAQVNRPFSFTPTNSEGPVDYWEIIAEGDGLPAWAGLNPDTGEITGTPTPSDANTENLVYMKAVGPRLGDYFGELGDIYGDFRPEGIFSFTLSVFMAPPEVVPVGEIFAVAVGQAFSFTPTNIGEAAEYWEADNLPDWLSLDPSTGEISGTPAVVANHTGINLRAVNAGGSSETGEFTITVLAGITAPALSGTPSPAAVGTAYGFTISNSGGNASSWSASGTLPAGINFNDGTFSGTATAAGSFGGIVVEASNSAGSDTLAVTLVVNPGQQAELQFADPGPISKALNEAAFTNLASGGSGSGAISYSSSDTAVASVDAASGEVTLVSAGSTTITASKAADSNYLATSAAYQLAVTSPVGIGGVPTVALQSSFYSWTPEVSGITALAWSLTGGALPTSLSLDTVTGEISGYPNASPGSYDFTLQATADDSNTYQASFTIQVFEPGCVAGSEGFCNLVAYQNSLTTFYFAADYLTAPTWAITDGELPVGLTLDSEAGTISGIATELGNYNFTLRASDGSSEIFYFIQLVVTEAVPL